MAMEQRDESLPSIERRLFMEVARRYGFTAAVVAGAAGTLLSTRASAQTAGEEREREKSAKFTMIVATPYVIGASRSYPIMQLDFKENIQNMTFGKVYVKLAPAGQLGVAAALVQKVQSGTIQCCQHSLSNFAPFAPAVDLVNIPYWVGENQQFTNLVTSEAWRREIHPKVEERGFKPLWYVNIGPRTVAIRKGGPGPIKVPDDLRGIKFRVPGSKILQQFYQLLGANPTPIAWGETPSAIKQGVADALDPAVGALFVFGFKDILSWVTYNNAVPDCQAYSCNLEWFKGLPKDVQEGIEFASETTFQQNCAKVPAARAYAQAEMARSGVKFYSPTDDEMKQWVQRAGHQLPAWEPFKKELAGSMSVFDRLLEAANTRGRYFVHDT